MSARTRIFELPFFSAPDPLTVEDRFSRSADCTSAEDAVQEERIVLTILDRNFPAWDLEDNQPSNWEVVVIREEPATRDCTIRVAHDARVPQCPKATDGRQFGFSVPSVSGVDGVTFNTMRLDRCVSETYRRGTRNDWTLRCAAPRIGPIDVMSRANHVALR